MSVRLRSKKLTSLWASLVILSGLLLEVYLIKQNAPLISWHAAELAFASWVVCAAFGTLFGHWAGQGFKVARWIDATVCFVICAIVYVVFYPEIFWFSVGFFVFGHQLWQMPKWKRGK